MLSESLRLKITGRSYGAKYRGLCLMLQTGRPYGAKEFDLLFTLLRYLQVKVINTNDSKKKNPGG
ncbi:MAG: hypothetical protein AABZ13_12170 [Planctomycetota bacterium]